MSTTQKTALLDASGLLLDLSNNLSGKGGYVWLGALKQFLRKEKPSWSSMTTWLELEKGPARVKANGLMENLTINLSGEDGYVWLGALKQFLRKENPVWWSSHALQSLRWKTIKNGVYKTYGHVSEAYNDYKLEIYGRAEAIIKNLRFKQFEPYEVDFGLFTIMDLGFDQHEELTYKQIAKRAQEKGLRKCTAFDALGLRVAYTEQPVNQRYDEHILVGMDVIDDQIFELANYGGHIVLSSMLIKAKFGSNKFGKRCKFVFRF